MGVGRSWLTLSLPAINILVKTGFGSEMEKSLVDAIRLGPELDTAWTRTWTAAAPEVGQPLKTMGKIGQNGGT